MRKIRIFSPNFSMEHLRKKYVSENFRCAMDEPSENPAIQTMQTGSITYYNFWYWNLSRGNLRHSADFRGQKRPPSVTREVAFDYGFSSPVHPAGRTCSTWRPRRCTCCNSGNGWSAVRNIRPQGTALFVPPERQRQQQAAQKSGHNPAQVQH